MDQLLTLRQGSLWVAEYLRQLNELMIQCEVEEDPRMTLRRFCTGLRSDIHREMLPHQVDTLDQAF